MEKQNLGVFGENLACEYLVKNGFNILRQNYRRKWGEIDIIARAKDRTLVFVEVKALTGSGKPLANLMPEDHLTAAKLRKLRRTCEALVTKNENLLDEKRGWRIDLIAIDLIPDKEPHIRHYENL